MAGGGVVEAALEVLGGDGLDGVVDGELDDEWGLGVGGDWEIAKKSRARTRRRDTGRTPAAEWPR